MVCIETRILSRSSTCMYSYLIITETNSFYSFVKMKSCWLLRLLRSLLLIS